jgi:hypothetical protein
VRLPAQRTQQCVGRVVGGHHQDSGRRGGLARPREDVEAAHAGQPDVEQHAVDGLALQRGERRGSVAGLFRLISGVLEKGRERVAKGPVVVDDQHAPGRSRGCHV